MATITLRESRDIKSQEIETLSYSIRTDKQTLIDSLIHQIDNDESDLDELKPQIVAYRENIKVKKDDIQKLEKEIMLIDQRLESLTSRLDEKLESICGRCVICSCSIMIPVKIICFQCPCEITLCLDCVRTYLKLNQPYHTRDPVGCLYCRVKNVIPTRAIDTYVINFELMARMDEAIVAFKTENSIDEKFVQCSKCNIHLDDITSLLKHKRGEEMEPCSESVRVCRYCRQYKKYKDMNGDFCINCT
jgi:hypothetical protein